MRQNLKMTKALQKKTKKLQKQIRQKKVNKKIFSLFFNCKLCHNLFAENNVKQAETEKEEADADEKEDTVFEKIWGIFGGGDGGTKKKK